MIRYLKFILIGVMFFASLTDFYSQSVKRSFFGSHKEAQSWQELTERLTVDKTGDSAKVMAIYKWITENVSYDYSVYMSGQPIRIQTPEMVFKRKKTTCTGYSNLMVAMLGHAGIMATDIEGFTQDFTLGFDSTKLSSDHAWVAFRADGIWYLADPTWDSGETGIYALIQTQEIKNTFWKRLKKFRFKNLFRKKNQITKYQTRTKVIFKEGFVRKPTTNFIFVPAEEFLKTHLPNISHFQLMHNPISVKEFCDSSHSLGDLRYTNAGSFNYSALNDQFENLEQADRMLWISDSSLLYHNLNHGDKAINAHNYLAGFYGEKSSSKQTLENFSSLSDSVILHAQTAIRLNKYTLARKRKLFSSAFQEERKNNNIQMTYLNFIHGHLTRLPEIYRKGRERINTREKVTLNNIELRIYQHVSRSKRIDTISSVNSEIQKKIENLEKLSDTLSRIQEIELNKGLNNETELLKRILQVRESSKQHSDLLYEGQFLNEWKIKQSDELLSTSLLSLSHFIRDSINTVLGNRKSWEYIMKLDQEIKQQQSLWNGWHTLDSTLDYSMIAQYSYGLLMDAMDNERAIVQTRLQLSGEMERALKNYLHPEIKEMNLDVHGNSKLKSMRQAYLNKMLNNKYNRSIKVYQSILSNAKNWKKNYQSKLKMLEKNQ